MHVFSQHYTLHCTIKRCWKGTEEENITHTSTGFSEASDWTASNHVEVYTSKTLKHTGAYLKGSGKCTEGEHHSILTLTLPLASPKHPIGTRR